MENSFTLYQRIFEQKINAIMQAASKALAAYEAGESNTQFLQEAYEVNSCICDLLRFTPYPVAVWREYNEVNYKYVARLRVNLLYLRCKRSEFIKHYYSHTPLKTALEPAKCFVQAAYDFVFWMEAYSRKVVVL